MEYIETKTTDPHFNLAMEQYIFDHLDRSKSYLFLWQNDNTIVIGKNQNTLGEINADFVRAHRINVVRRLSGGGAVYHDLGNLNFTFITDSDESDLINFRIFCQPIVDTLATFGIKAEISGRNDITIDGKKFSGNAQYVREHRVMHHGTLLFNSDPGVISGALKVSPDKIRSKGVKSVSSRVTNLKEHLPAGTTVEDFKARLLEHMAQAEPLHRLELTDTDIAAIKEIQRQRYDTWEWNFGSSPAYSINLRQRFEDCGSVEVSMDVKGGCIASIAFSGDFFGNGDLSELSEKLIGCPYTCDDVAARLKALHLETYIRGITADQLAALIASAAV